MTTSDPYKRLAERLDNLPNGFPPSDDGSELRLLAELFTQDEADLAAQLRISLETSAQIAERLGREYGSTRELLKSMAKKGLIKANRIEGGLGYGLLPFIVGIAENQAGRFSKEFAQLYEDYYQRSFVQVMGMQPPFHRIVPVGESIKMNMEVAPYESVSWIIEQAKSWGVLNCMCRTETAYIGKPCKHPLDVCMVLSLSPDAFSNSSDIKSVTKEEAYETLRRAETAGLVHCVSNNQTGDTNICDWYICNCCTCSCGILRGMAELGIANVVASSAFINTVDATLCNACGLCVENCQFNALTVDDFALVNRMRCVGCGACVNVCPDNALALIRRPEEEIKPVPVSMAEWGRQRAEQRGIDLSSLL